MDSNVIGYYPEVSGLSPYGVVSGYDDVSGRHHRHHGHHGHHGGTVRVPAMTPAQLEAQANARGMMVVPQNQNQGGMRGDTMPTGQMLLASGQRTLFAAFIKAAAVAPGASWTVVAQIQRGFQGSRFLVEAVVDATGADASGFIDVQAFNVGQRNQVVSAGSLTTSLFLPNTFDARVLLDPCGSGNFIAIGGTLAATAPGPCTVKASGVGAASL
jgi:hypothetical protein